MFTIGGPSTRYFSIDRAILRPNWMHSYGSSLATNQSWKYENLSICFKPTIPWKTKQNQAPPLLLSLSQCTLSTSSALIPADRTNIQWFDKRKQIQPSRRKIYDKNESKRTPWFIQIFGIKAFFDKQGKFDNWHTDFQKFAQRLVESPSYFQGSKLYNKLPLKHEQSIINFKRQCDQFDSESNF